MELKGHDQLCADFRDGKRDVLEALYKAHVDAVEGVLRHGFSFSSQGKSYRFRGFDEPFRLQEAIQDGFIHAFRDKARRQYDGSRSFRPFLLTIVRNRVIDRFRREQLESQLFVHIGEVTEEDETEQETLARLAEDDEQTSPEVETIQNELAETLEAYLDGLDEKQAAIVEHYLLGSMTQHEMADHLDTSRNDVRKHIRLIREGLLRHLKSAGIIGRMEVSEVFSAVTLIVGLTVDGEMR